MSELLNWILGVAFITLFVYVHSKYEALRAAPSAALERNFAERIQRRVTKKLFRLKRYERWLDKFEDLLDPYQIPDDEVEALCSLRANGVNRRYGLTLLGVSGLYSRLYRIHTALESAEKTIALVKDRHVLLLPREIIEQRDHPYFRLAVVEEDVRELAELTERCSDLLERIRDRLSC